MATSQLILMQAGHRRRALALWSHVVALLLLMLVIASCGDGSAQSSVAGGVRDGVDVGYESVVWVSTVGLAQVDPDVWGPRFEEICVANRAGDGDSELESLARRYIAEDASLSVRSSDDLPTLSDAVDSLLLIAGSICER